MKKLIFGIFLFLAFAVSAGATTFYIVDDTGNKITYEDKKIANSYAFLVGDVKTNKKRLNNLAYVARYRNDIKFHAIIQLLILKESNPTKEYYLSDGINKIDIEELANLIELYINEYARVPSFAYTTYEMSYEEPYTIYTSENAGFYKVESNDISVEIYSNEIRLTPHKSGNQQIEFINSDLNILNDYIYATSPAYDEFTMNLVIPHNKIELIIETPDNKSYNLMYGIYDEKDNLIEEFLITPSSNTITFPRGMNVTLKEITSNPIYVLDDDRFLTDNLSYNKIFVKKEYQTFAQTITTFSVDLNTNNQNIVPTDVTIYDSNNKYYGRYTSSSSCNVSLPYGTYTLFDNITNDSISISVSKNDTINLYRYKINAIKSQEDILKVSIANKDIPFHRDGDLIIFDEAITPGEYTISIGDNTYLVDLSDSGNYTIQDKMLIYNYTHKDTSTEQLDDDISISIPNTGLSLNLKGEILFEKKNKIYLIVDYPSYCN